MSPLCFVLMPVGCKPGSQGGSIDFDAVWRELVAPAVVDAGLTPIRPEQEQSGGVTHETTFERLILCDYAIADVTLADARLFYELGVRRAVKPDTTTLIFAEGNARLSFDAASLRPLPYQLGPDGRPSSVDVSRSTLSDRLKAARRTQACSPLYRLVDDFPDIQRLKTDVFRERVDYSPRMKQRLKVARDTGLDAVKAIEAELAASPGGIAHSEASAVVDLYLSYRAMKAWPAMIDVASKMDAALARTTMVREQLGLALSRLERFEEAEHVLKAVIADRGPSSETYALLGRVYKDRWLQSLKAQQHAGAESWLSKAIQAYLQGFEADWRDAFPGVNAVTLMEVSEPPDARRLELIPVVAYAAERRIAGGQADYWDHATRLELAVLAEDEAAAVESLAHALAAVRERWEPESTWNNLRMIRHARRRRGRTIAWAAEIEAELARAGGLEDKP